MGDYPRKAGGRRVVSTEVGSRPPVIPLDAPCPSSPLLPPLVREAPFRALPFMPSLLGCRHRSRDGVQRHRVRFSPNWKLTFRGLRNVVCPAIPGLRSASDWEYPLDKLRSIVGPACRRGRGATAISAEASPGISSLRAERQGGERAGRLAAREEGENGTVSGIPAKEAVRYRTEEYQEPRGSERPRWPRG